MKKTFIAAALSLCLPVTGYAQEAQTYLDAQGREVHFPLGALSFADEVISVQVGKPAPRSEVARKHENILSEPNNGSLSLGCGGSVVVRFSDNALVDVPGPDLYVFEIGKEVEATLLEISTNGADWLDVGPIAGATAEIDIADHVKGNGAVYQYIRLTDRNINCKAGKYSGADIDAVGAIGAAVRLTLSGEVLFDFDSAELRDTARAALDEVADEIRNYPSAQVIVEGHTDAKGSDAYNQTLSEQRAESVRRFLVQEGVVESEESEIRGHGESRPVASNDTETGRQSNRRVDLIIIPR